VQFGSDLDEDTRTQIELGQRLTELLKQHQYQPMGVWEQVASVVAIQSGSFKKVAVSHIKDAQTALLTELWTHHKDAMRTLNNGDAPEDKTVELIKKTAEKVSKGFKEDPKTP
jgi:F-type H+-transporting ATPase subunit alpha